MAIVNGKLTVQKIDLIERERRALRLSYPEYQKQLAIGNTEPMKNERELFNRYGKAGEIWQNDIIMAKE